MKSRMPNNLTAPKFPFKLFGCGITIMGLFVISFIVLFFGSIFWNAFGGNQRVAEKAAKKYAANIPGVTNIQCNRYDSDADSYVTCTLFRGAEKPMQIECGLSGCRMPKLLIPQE